MTINSVHNKYLSLAIKTKTISLSEFQDLLESSTRDNKIRVQWETLEGNTDYYWMWWDSGAYVGDEASQTKAKEGMFNIKTTFDAQTGRWKWRTLSLQTVSKARFQNTLYIVK